MRKTPIRLVVGDLISAKAATGRQTTAFVASEPAVAPTDDRYFRFWGKDWDDESVPFLLPKAKGVEVLAEHETIETITSKVREIIAYADDNPLSTNFSGLTWAKLQDLMDANMLLVQACDALGMDDDRLLDNDCALANAVTRRFDQIIEERKDRS